MQRNTIFLACFFICVNCFSQQYPFVYYTPKDGLVNSRVRSIKQDSKGRMLFFTYGGLSIYDGTRFINYHQQDGLANDLVNDVIEITPDSFLVATNTQKLNTLVRGQVGIYQTADNFSPTINRFLKSENGKWYTAADEGLFDFENKKFTRISLIKNGKDLGTCLDKIIEWKNFFLIIPWNNELPQKLILYNRLSNTVDDVITDKRVYNITVDPKDQIWATTSDGTQLLDTSRLKNGKIIFATAPPSYSSVKSASLLFDAYGNTWLYNDNEIEKIDPSFQTQTFSTEQGLKAGTLTCLFQDKEGIMWMGTDGNGVIKLKSVNIQLINSLGNKQAMISAICEVKDTTWLFNQPDNCIYRMTGKEIKKFPLKKKLTVAKIYSYQDKLYLSTSEGILLIDKKNKASSYLYPRDFFVNPSISIGNGMIDAYGTIISITLRDTAHYLAIIKQNKIIEQFSLNTFIDQMVFDQQGYLWAATRNDHIMVFKLNPSDELHYLQLIEDFSRGLPIMGARSITIDNKNDLWIGTRHYGLFRFTLNNHQLSLKDHYTTKNGLTDNFIYTLACDNNNNIWVGTQTGLDKIFKRNQNYIIANIGKNNNNFQIVTRIEIAKDGTIWSLNNDGTIFKVSPESAVLNNTTPPLLLTSIKVNSETSNETVHNFSYLQNNFSFNVAAPSFEDEQSIQYSYLLEGADNRRWSDPSNLSAFSFVNLRPGSYTLYVRCNFPEAMYPPQEITYSFTINEPWWRSWWFIVIMVLSSVLLLFLIVRDYYQRKLQHQKNRLEKKQAIEKERTRIATDMHDDLGAGLSRIKFLSETIGIKKQQEQPIEEDIIKIREYSHQMINKMGEIVWALNEKNDSLSDLIVYTRAYAMEYLSENGINCRVELPSIPETIFVSGEFRRNVFLCVKETLHNVVKHAQANIVCISIEAKKDLKIVVHDDGIGFRSSEIRPFSNGISNIEKRMKEINGTSGITGMKGTTVTLKAPLS